MRRCSSTRCRRRRSSSARRASGGRRTRGGDRSFLEQHCNTAVGEEPSDLLYTGAVALLRLAEARHVDADDATCRTGRRRAATRSSRSRVAKDGGTMWAGTGTAACSSRRTSIAANPASVTFTRLDTAVPAAVARCRRSSPTRPTRTTRSSRSRVSTSNTPTTPGTCSTWCSTRRRYRDWTNISYDLGDQPINDAVLDARPATCTCRPTSASTRSSTGRRPGSRPPTACRRQPFRGSRSPMAKNGRPPDLRGDARPQRLPAAAQVANAVRTTCTERPRQRGLSHSSRRRLNPRRARGAEGRRSEGERPERARAGGAGGGAAGAPREQRSGRASRRGA